MALKLPHVVSTRSIGRSSISGKIRSRSTLIDILMTHDINQAYRCDEGPSQAVYYGEADYVVGRKQERDSFRGPRIAWERTDIAFRRQSWRRRRRVSFGTTAKLLKQL